MATKYQSNLKVFGLTGPGRDTTIYRIRGDAANHYTIDAVEEIRKRSHYYDFGSP
jgi:hypothetical protein